MDVTIKGILQRFQHWGTTGADSPLRLTGIGSQAVAITEPLTAERLRAGRRFVGATQVLANGIAPVQTIPTTAAAIGIWNGEPQGTGGKSYFVDLAHWWVGSGTPAVGATLLAALSNGRLTTIPTANATGHSIANLAGSAMGTKAIMAALTLPAGSVWFPLNSSFQIATSILGSGASPFLIHGGILVPPGYGLGLAILSGAGTTPLYPVSLIWDELEMDLE